MEGEEKGSPSEAQPDAAEDRLSARERRRQRVREQERRELPKKTLKRVGIAAAILLALVGVVWAVNYLSGLAEECELENSHEHTSFLIFVPNEANASQPQRVAFNHPTYDLSSQQNPAAVFPLKSHMHQPNDWQIHSEFGCANFPHFLDYMGVDLSHDSLTLDDKVNGGKEYEESGNQTLRFFLFTPNLDDRSGRTGNWTEEPDLSAHQPRDLERIVVAFGNWTDAQIEEMKRQAPVPTDSVPPELR